MDLWQAEWCPHSHRVRQRLTELGLDFVAHQVPADPKRRERMRRAVGGDSIPVLVDDGHVLTGDEAILAYLDATYEEAPDAESHRAKARAEVPEFQELGA